MGFLFKSKPSKKSVAKSLAEEWNLNMDLSRKEQRALLVISSHVGKRAVFESYLETNPALAEKYLKFISNNPGARYVKWNADKQKFVE